MNARIRLFTGLTAAALALTAISLLRPLGLQRLHEQGRIIFDRHGAPIAYVMDRQGEWKFATSADQVDPLLPHMLIAIEDRRFAADPGIDPLAIARAVWQMARAGHLVSGASTLTMQVARLLYPAPRTLVAKLSEADEAIALTSRFSKPQIMGMWLSLAPFGGNIVGVQAASRIWFGKSPASLSPAEAALLIALCRRPEALRPDRHPIAAAMARNRVLREAWAEHIISADALRQALAATLPTQRQALPLQSPQITTRLPNNTRTTLDAGLNQALAALADRDLAGMAPAESLAIMIIDTHSNAVRAVFAGDWANPRRAGFLDLTAATRSPGSALKPFLYGLAFADGLAGPSTIFSDLPAHFGAYAPDDFTHHFMGQVSAAQALRRSLNLPAVSLMRAYRPARFAAALAAAGTPLALPRGALPSLPLALGGAGVSMREMARLYAGLGNDGSIRPLHLIQADSQAGQTGQTGQTGRALPLLAPSVAREITGILTRNLPFGGPGGVAWKTGTSAGNRDDWAVGFDQRHAVLVWVGRPDGGALPGAAAIDRAMPIFTQVFGLLPAAPLAPYNPPPPASLAQGPLAAPLRFAFPPPDATLQSIAGVDLRAMGGARPLTFLVDGAPLTSIPALRSAHWTPPGPGFYRLTILDAQGQHVTTRVRIISPSSG
jgi:penicillin-binding protein 1C